MAGGDTHAVIGQAGEDFLAAAPSVVGSEVDPVKLEDAAVAHLHDVAGPHRQCLGRRCRWQGGREGRGRGRHRERAIQHVAERRRRVADLSRRDPGQVVGHGAVEGDRVHPIKGTPVAADVRERSEEAVEVDRRECGRGIGDRVVGQRQPAGGDGVDAGVRARVFAGIPQVDSEGAGVVDAHLVDLHGLAGEPDGKDALLSAAGDRRARNQERLERTGGDAGQVDRDPVGTVARKGAPGDRHGGARADPVSRGVGDAGVGQGEVLRRAGPRWRAHRDPSRGVSNRGTHQQVGFAGIEDQAAPIAGGRRRADARGSRDKDRAAARDRQRHRLEAGQLGAGRREAAVLDGDRTGQDPCVITVGQREIAADQQVAIDDVAEQAAGCDRLPGECFAVAMEGDRVEAVGEPRVAADRTVEVGMADPVQPDGGVVQGARATPDDVIALQCQHVGALEVDAGTSRRPDRAGVLDRIVLDVDRLAGETNRADRLADAALERILVRRV